MNGPTDHLPGEEIAVDGECITIPSGITIRAASAATILGDTVAGPARSRLLERLVEQGAEAELAYRSNITARLLEERLQDLGRSMQQELDGILKSGGRSVEEQMLRTLGKFENELKDWTGRYFDPRSPDGLPEITANRLRQVATASLEQIRSMLTADSETGPLAKVADRILKQVQESERNVVSQLARRQAADSTGFHKGRSYEESLSAKLAQIAVATGGQLDRCSDRMGVKRAKHGDHLLTFAFGSQTIRIVIEAKARGEGQRFSFDAVSKACENSRRNREANAALFVSETRDLLPDGVPFGQVARADYFVTFDASDGDDLALVAGVYLARAAALETVSMVAGADVDRDTARALVSDIRQRIERRTRIRKLHSTAVNAINGATKELDEDTEVVVTCLSKLDALLIA